ncbi:uncharacterized protein LOC113782437 [Coffea eugenioides]|uniref:uncharacterized protein LOC113782437 n=1 Tax=Coffea eugenioides TaxID=49369 RepID=UPI000F610DAE|nr:uncharacterized protein LOC113782437 [Coffea eugenioides]
MTTAINRMTDILERLAERRGVEPLNQLGGQDRGEDRALERFLKFNSPKFTDEPDPEVAENWLERMANIFAALDYAEERRVTFAIFQFEGAARGWWDMIKGKWERAQTPWTWENLLGKFNEKFLPPLVQEKWEDEFIKVKQGASSVAENEEKFTKLSRTPGVRSAPNENPSDVIGRGDLLNASLQKTMAVVQKGKDQGLQ